MQTVRGQHLVEVGDLEPLGSRWLLNASTARLNKSSSIPNAVEGMKMTMNMTMEMTKSKHELELKLKHHHFDEAAAQFLSNDERHDHPATLSVQNCQEHYRDSVLPIDAHFCHLATS